MSSVPLEQQPVGPQATIPTDTAEVRSQAIQAKRPVADDEIQFVSSNPVKKRRQSEQKPIHTMVELSSTPASQPAQAMTQPPLTPPPQDTTVDQHMAPPQTTPTDRCRSMGAAKQPSAPTPEMTPDSRGASLPVFQNFAFPQLFSPIARPPRISEAVSPKQFPQALPSPPGSEVNTNHPLPFVSETPSQTSVSIDQISCLDFHGMPTNAPGFDVSRLFSTDGGIMSGLGMGNMGNGQGLPPFTPMANPNAIPFTMYSTGNIVPMPQAHCTSQPPSSFPHTPMQSPLRHDGVPVSNAKHQHLPGNFQGGHTMHSRAPSPSPGSKPPCLHCVRLRQEALLRQAQGSPRPMGDAVQPHQQVNHNHSSSCYPPPKPTNNAPSSPFQSPSQSPFQSPFQSPSPSLTHPTPTPRSTPTTYGQPAQGERQTPVSFPAPARPNNNLFRDIAETVQATFPYAQVAARHGIAPARVAEVVSGMLKRGSVRPAGPGTG